jgi:hypothetical protein
LWQSVIVVSAFRPFGFAVLLGGVTWGID